MKFNEDSRVKIPTILHLVRLGYEYLSLKGQKWDETTNIFSDIFNKSIKRLNPEFTRKPKTHRTARLVIDNVDEWAGEGEMKNLNLNKYIDY